MKMHDLAARLFPICRSLTGPGVDETLAILKEHLPELVIQKVPTGTRVFDWEVPREWVIRDAYVLGPDGAKIIDFKKSNLHVVSYSAPVDQELSLEELQPHLHSHPKLPDAIPYVTSYYKETWGFCLSQKQRQALKPGKYRVVIDSELKAGHLTYGEWILPGNGPAKNEEVFLSTYVCHPSMANNELSGPVVATHLACWLKSAPRKRTHRLVFVPETIGSLTYLSRNIDALKKNVVAGFNLSCLGDDRAYSYLPSRAGDTLADRAALQVLKHRSPDFFRYTYLDRGSDERQYCSPGVDLPVASVMRTKYGAYPEYHTSLDDLSVVTPSGLQGGFEALRECLELLEGNERLQATCIGEPQLGKRGLYSALSTGRIDEGPRQLLDFLAYADGTRDLIGICELTGISPAAALRIKALLLKEGLVRSIEPA